MKWNGRTLEEILGNFKAAIDSADPVYISDYMSASDAVSRLLAAVDVGVVFLQGNRPQPD